MATMITEVYDAFLAGGAPEAKAREAAEALSSESLSTKGDIVKTEGRLARDIAEVREGLADNIVSVEQKLTRDIAAAEERLNYKIAAVKEELNHKIDAVREELSGEIAAVEQKLTRDIAAVREELSGEITALKEALNHKIDVVKEELTRTIERKINDLKVDQKIDSLKRDIGKLDRDMAVMKALLLIIIAAQVIPLLKALAVI